MRRIAKFFCEEVLSCLVRRGLAVWCGVAKVDALLKLLGEGWAELLCEKLLSRRVREGVNFRVRNS